MVGLERREAAIVAEEVRNVWRLMFIWRGAHGADDDDDDADDSFDGLELMVGI